MKLLLAFLLTASLLAVAGGASAQAPGAPISPCAATVFDVAEGSTELFADEHRGPNLLPCPVFGGYVVLVESADPALRNDLHNWSDVLAFTNGGPINPGGPTDRYFYISDAPDQTGVENGITVTDLAFAGLTSADIIANPTTVFLPEGLNAAAPDVNDYVASGLSAGPIHYLIHSDKPEGPTATRNSTWGRMKMLYR